MMSTCGINNINSSLLGFRTLACLLEVIHKELSAFIANKYESIGENFTMDNGFLIFYTHSSELKKKELQSITEENLDILRKEYTNQYTTSTMEATNGIQGKIQKIIDNLPNELRFQHKKSFDELKQALVKSNYETIT
jgi:hypothetical protein